jgi:hypothetical protein
LRYISAIASLSARSLDLHGLVEHRRRRLGHAPEPVLGEQVQNIVHRGTFAIVVGPFAMPP